MIQQVYNKLLTGNQHRQQWSNSINIRYHIYLDNSQGLKLTWTRKSWLLSGNLAVTKQPQTEVQVFKRVLQTVHHITLTVLLFDRT